jgi:hypothetical protein
MLPHCKAFDYIEYCNDAVLSGHTCFACILSGGRDVKLLAAELHVFLIICTENSDITSFV